MRPEVIYYLANNAQLLGDYAYAAFYPNEPKGAPILAVDQPAGKIREGNQWFRVEERFQRKLVNEQLADGYLYTWRFRCPVSGHITLRLSVYYTLDFRE